MTAWLLGLALMVAADATTTCDVAGEELPVAVTALRHSELGGLELAPPWAELDVEVRCLRQWVDAHKGAGTCTDKVRLVLDGQRIEGLMPTRCGELEGTDAAIEFRLKALDRTDPAWMHLLRTRDHLWSDEFSVTVSWDGEEPIPGKENALRLALLDMFGLGLGTVGVLFLAILIGVLAVRTNMLKEWARVQGEEDTHRWAWSLARVQAAWWFFLTFAVWLFLSIAMGELTNFTDGAVGMLLLSSGTLVIGGSATPPVKPKDENFFGDLVYLENGPSLSRLQNVVWTLVFGLGFAWMSIKGLTMTEISTTMLTLMGVVNGAYVGAKATSVS